MHKEAEIIEALRRYLAILYSTEVNDNGKIPSRCSDDDKAVVSTKGFNALAEPILRKNDKETNLNEAFETEDSTAHSMTKDLREQDLVSLRKRTTASAFGVLGYQNQQNRHGLKSTFRTSSPPAHLSSHVILSHRPAKRTAPNHSSKSLAVIADGHRALQSVFKEKRSRVNINVEKLRSNQQCLGCNSLLSCSTAGFVDNNKFFYMYSCVSSQ